MARWPDSQKLGCSEQKLRVAPTWVQVCPSTSHGNLLEAREHPSQMWEPIGIAVQWMTSQTTLHSIEGDNDSIAC